MKRFAILALLAIQACTPAPQEEKVAEEKHCAINPGKYQVQTASFLKNQQSYELFVLGAQPCVKQPVVLENVQMAQLNTEGDQKEAKVEIRGNENILYLSKSFSIDLVSEVENANGQVQREQSMWTPFLAGAAGMVAGQMISNAFFNKPRYVQPPVMQPGQSRASGIGAYGNTRQEAFNSYNNNLSKAGLKPLPASSLDSKKPSATSNIGRNTATKPKRSLLKGRSTPKKRFRMKRRR